MNIVGKIISNLDDVPDLKFKGITKIELSQGFLKVYREELMMGCYSLDCFTEDSNLKYIFEE